MIASSEKDQEKQCIPDGCMNSLGMNLSVTHAPMYLQDSLSIQILENKVTYQQKLIQIIFVEIFKKDKKGSKS